MFWWDVEISDAVRHDHSLDPPGINASDQRHSRGLMQMALLFTDRASYGRALKVLWRSDRAI